jgi:glycerol-3-phosphate dehydrogenase
VPQRELSVVGTSSWVTEDPDHLAVPADHVEKMFLEGSTMIPAIRSAQTRATWSAARPLIGERGASTGRELSRTFKCFDHAAEEGVEGFVTISGGKATTLRAMAEATANVVCKKLGIESPCRTREYPLLPHTAYYA